VPYFEIGITFSFLYVHQVFIVIGIGITLPPRLCKLNFNTAYSMLF